MGVAKVIKKWGCHVLNATWVFFTPVASNKVEHLPVPFDITPFSSTPTIAARPHKRDWVPIAICTSPVIHLVCPPKHSVYSLSSISLRTTVTLRRTCRLRFSSGGAHKVDYKRCANGECCLRKAESVILNKSPRESESITAVLCITTTVLKSSAVILKIHNPPPPHSIQCWKIKEIVPWRFQHCPWGGDV